MRTAETSRRDFIRFAGTAAVLPLVWGCRPATYAQNSDILSTLRRNAIADPGCEWCGARDVPDGVSWEADLSRGEGAGERLVISGTVFDASGRPASGTLIYFYHTDTKGLYGGPGEHRHGRYRGWMLTGQEGQYRLETIRPASYPGSTIAAHIHMTVTTSERREDWIDSVLFEGDPFITAREREGRRGGYNPVVVLRRNTAGTYHGTRDIRLM